MKKYLFGLLCFLIILSGCNGVTGTIATAANSNNNNNNAATVILDSSSGGVANNAINVSLYPIIVLKFSAVMNPTTVNTNNVFLSTNIAVENPQNLIAITNITPNFNNTGFSFSPVSALNSNTKYYVIISANIKTAINNSAISNQFNFTTGNMTIPIANLLNPIDNAVNIGLNPNIQIAFSESVINFNFSTVILHEGSVNGTMAYFNAIVPGANNIYTLIPANSLKQQTTYYLVLSDFINDGKNFLNPTIFNFTTGYFTAPGVNIINPSNNATETPLSPNIQLQFSEQVSNVNNNTIVLHQGNTNGTTVNLNPIVSGTIADSYTTSPVNPLNIETTYYLTVNNGIVDNYGNALVATSFNFTTASNSPTVNMITPNNNATGVSSSPSIQIQFNKAVQNVNSNTVSLCQDSPSGESVVLNAISSGSNNSYIITPTNSLKSQTTYYLVLNSGITDNAGDALVPTNFNFSIGNFTIPIVNMVSPLNNATGVMINTSMKIQFSELVTNVNTNNISLYQGNPTTGQLINITITPVVANSYAYIITPTSPLIQLTAYYLVLTDGIVDKFNNSLVATTFNFTTGDFTAPVANIISPESGATGVLLTIPNLQIAFTKQVLGVNFNTVSLHANSPTGGLVTFDSIVESSVLNNYTLTLTNPLMGKTNYYLVLSGFISDVNNNYLNPTVFNFKTGDFSVPVVQMTTPPLVNMNGMSLNPNLTIKFNKPVLNVNTTNVTLRQDSPTGKAISTLVIAADPDDSLTYNLSTTAALNTSTAYYLVLTNGITDNAGNVLANTNFKFTTAASATTPPTVNTITPTNNATGISVNPTIEIQFNQPVQNVTNQTVTLHIGSASGPVVFLSNPTTSDNIYYIFTFSTVLNLGTTYYLVLNGSIVDYATDLLVPINFNFTIVPFYWIHLSNLNFPMNFMALALDSNNIPYVAYQNESQNTITVQQFKNGGWNQLGQTFTNLGNPYFQFFSLAINKNNDVYIAYEESTQDIPNISVRIYDANSNQWKYFGNTLFATGLLFNKSLAFDSNGIPYVVYSDNSNNYRCTVRKFNNSNNAWVILNAGFSTDYCGYATLAIDNKDNLYVAYANGGTGGGQTIVEQSTDGGLTWIKLGSGVGNSKLSIFQSLALDNKNNPYVAYADKSNNSKISVAEYNGSTWVSLGAAGFSLGAASYLNLVLDSNNIPYVAYQDESNSNITAFMKYENGNWINMGATASFQNNAQSQYLVLGNNNQLYLSYLLSNISGIVQEYVYNNN